MPKLTLSRSRSSLKPERDDEHSATESKGSGSKPPSKIVKKVKRQLWRLDSLYHHVTHTEHHHHDHGKPRGAQRVVSSPSHVFPTIGALVRSSSSPPISSPRPRRNTWNEKYVREVDVHSFDRATSYSDATQSSEHLPFLPPTSADAPLSTYVIAEETSPTISPEPPVQEVEEFPFSSQSPPTVHVETEVSDSFLIVEDTPSGEDSSTIFSPRTESPAHTAPFDIPRSPLIELDDAKEPSTLRLFDTAITSPPLSEEVQEERETSPSVPPLVASTQPLSNIDTAIVSPPLSEKVQQDGETSLPVPPLVISTVSLSNINHDIAPPSPLPENDQQEDETSLAVPTMRSNPNLRRPFSANPLTWWLSRNVMYNADSTTITHTRPWTVLASAYGSLCVMSGKFCFNMMIWCLKSLWGVARMGDYVLLGLLILRGVTVRELA